MITHFKVSCYSIALFALVFIFGCEDKSETKETKSNNVQKLPTADWQYLQSTTEARALWVEEPSIEVMQKCTTWQELGVHGKELFRVFLFSSAIFTATNDKNQQQFAYYNPWMDVALIVHWHTRSASDQVSHLKSATFVRGSSLRGEVSDGSKPTWLIRSNNTSFPLALMQQQRDSENALASMTSIELSAILTDKEAIFATQQMRNTAQQQLSSIAKYLMNKNIDVLPNHLKKIVSHLGSNDEKVLHKGLDGLEGFPVELIKDIPLEVRTNLAPVIVVRFSHTICVVLQHIKAPMSFWVIDFKIKDAMPKRLSYFSHNVADHLLSPP